MNQQIAAWQDDVLSPVDKLEVHKKGLELIKRKKS